MNLITAFVQEVEAYQEAIDRIAERDPQLAALVAHIRGKTMSREIKFRAWDKDHAMMISNSGMPRTDYPRLSSYEYMQWTGLRDKNGKEIYEGDVVQDDGFKQIVEWDRDLTGFEPFNNYDRDCSEYYPSHDCEVIGNIYENPELIKQA